MVPAAARAHDEGTADTSMCFVQRYRLEDVHSVYIVARCMSHADPACALQAQQRRIAGLKALQTRKLWFC